MYSLALGVLDGWESGKELFLLAIGNVGNHLFFLFTPFDLEFLLSFSLPFSVLLIPYHFLQPRSVILMQFLPRYSRKRSKGTSPLLRSIHDTAQLQQWSLSLDQSTFLAISVPGRDLLGVFLCFIPLAFSCL